MWLAAMDHRAQKITRTEEFGVRWMEPLLPPPPADHREAIGGSGWGWHI